MLKLGEEVLLITQKRKQGVGHWEPKNYGPFFSSYDGNRNGNSHGKFWGLLWVGEYDALSKAI